jgi:quercetin dioxygenase-like cupin family protein
MSQQPSVRPLSEPIVESVQVDVAGLYIRSYLLPEAGTIIPQHVHPYDHATLVGSGTVDLCVDGVYVGQYRAGQAIFVEAGKKHIFQSVEPMTRLSCIHHTESAVSAQQKE